jgi:adenylosuccinate synthase
MEHTIVVDLGYGDAGKGTTVDWLCASAPVRRPVAAVVRFNGGAQAAHNVITPDGRHHTFAQFGSGTLTGTPTFLSRFAMVEPLALIAEAEHLAALGVAHPLGLLAIDRQALLTTPYHRAVNRAAERARGAERHGSCGIGVGQTAAYALEYPKDAPRVGDCQTPALLARKLRVLRDHATALIEKYGESTLPPPPVDVCLDAYRAFADAVHLVDETHLRALIHKGPVIFEGAQGVLLDEWRGFHPYTTWSTCTFANAETLLAEAGRPGDALRMGVVRTYTTRHGPGPLVTEDAALAAELPEPHNRHGAWQGAFRVGHFDAVAHRYAIRATGGIDALAVTHLDAAQRHRLSYCDTYQEDQGPLTEIPLVAGHDFDRRARLTDHLLRTSAKLTEGPGPGPSAANDWPPLIASALGAPVLVTSHGPSRSAKRRTAAELAASSSWAEPLLALGDREVVRVVGALGVPAVDVDGHAGG